MGGDRLMPMLERVEHEILSVTVVPRKSGGGSPHVIKRHHTMYVHAAMTADAATIPAGGTVALTLRLHPWDIATEQVDTGTVLAGEDRTFDLLVDGEAVGELATVNGRVEESIQFPDAGTYLIEVRHETTQGAAVEVVVS